MSRGDIQVLAEIACLHHTMVWLHTHGLMCHIFTRVASRCLAGVFSLPKCPSVVGPPEPQRLSSDLTVFSQQPASDTDSACPACETLLSYSYLVAGPW